MNSQILQSAYFKRVQDFWKILSHVGPTKIMCGLPRFTKFGNAMNLISNAQEVHIEPARFWKFSKNVPAKIWSKFLFLYGFLINTRAWDTMFVSVERKDCHFASFKYGLNSKSMKNYGTTSYMGRNSRTLCRNESKVSINRKK